MIAIKNLGRRISHFIGPNVLYGFQYAWLKFGYKFLDLRSAAWVIRRPEWLMQKPGPFKSLEAELPAQAEPANHIAERLIAMHQRGVATYSANDLIPADSIWGSHLQNDTGPMRTLTESRDVQGLELV